MSPKLKCHQNFNVTKTKHVLKMLIKIKEIGPDCLGLVIITVKLIIIVVLIVITLTFFLFSFVYQLGPVYVAGVSVRRLKFHPGVRSKSRLGSHHLSWAWGKGTGVIFYFVRKLTENLQIGNVHPSLSVIIHRLVIFYQGLVPARHSADKSRVVVFK